MRLKGAAGGGLLMQRAVSSIAGTIPRVGGKEKKRSKPERDGRQAETGEGAGRQPQSEKKKSQEPPRPNIFVQVEAGKVEVMSVRVGIGGIEADEQDEKNGHQH